MSLDKIIRSLTKFIKNLEKATTDPRSDSRYEYAIDIIKHLNDYKKLLVIYENTKRELLTRTDKLIMK
jgi:hypothetical protein